MPLASKNGCLHLFLLAIDLIHLKLACNVGMHNILDEFELGSDGTTDFGVNCS